MCRTRAEIIGYLCDRISPLYPQRERQLIARSVAAHLEGCNPIQYLVDPNAEVRLEGLERVADELAEGRPMQYVMGYTDFCDHRFSVREGVLIPRPETEELVAWVVEEAEGFAAPRVLDLCTGSGCIAVSLNLALAGSRVVAIDLSEEALAVARENATRLGAEVDFRRDDVLGEMPALDGREFDFIISNPPYIPRSEREQMHRNVTEYEPSMALFVEDDDPLIFYRSIARAGHRLLAEQGKLFFEVHYLWAEATADMLREEGYCDVKIRLDGFGKQRMVCCQKIK